MTIPRDRVSWYCERGQHDRCGIPQTCACRACYGATREMSIEDIEHEARLRDRDRSGT